ncbi:MAG TPA: hypothetical protein VHO70_00415 [Chitinispirillaceae bacterium]|nr:hypothetical protein [Chitinispirillaceae bacterium]
MSILLPATSNAQQLKLNLIGSASRQAGPQFDNFDWGFAVGGELFFYLNRHILLGAHVLYNKWTPDENSFTEQISSFFDSDIVGDAFSIELLPVLRVTTRYQSAINIFLQAGAGLYIINNEITIDANSFDATVEETFGAGTRGRFGISLAAGLTLGDLNSLSIDLFPAFNLVFLNEGDAAWRYFTLNLGIALNI